LTDSAGKAERKNFATDNLAKAHFLALDRASNPKQRSIATPRRFMP